MLTLNSFETVRERAVAGSARSKSLRTLPFILARGTGRKAGPPLDEDNVLTGALGRLGLAKIDPAEIALDMRPALQRLPDFWEAALAPATLRSRKTDIERFGAWCVEHAPGAFSNDLALAQAMEAHLIDVSRSYAPGTVRRVSTSLTALAAGVGSDKALRGAQECRRLSVRAACRARSHTPARKHLRLSAGQLAILREAIVGSNHRPLQQARDLALFSIMCDVLARRSEISAMRVEDIDLAAGTVLIARSKTDQEGVGVLYTLSATAQAACDDWLALSGLRGHCAPDGLSPPLFPGFAPDGSILRGDDGDMSGLAGRSISRILAGYGAAAGIDGVSGHTIRRSVARLLHQGGMEEVEIMKHGRWSTLQQMRVYVGVREALSGVADLVL